MKAGYFILLATSMVLATGCYYDVEEELYPAKAATCDTTGVTYATTVQPILAANCYSCHSAAVAQSGVVLEGFVNARQYAVNGLLLKTVSHDPGVAAMPQGVAKLPACDIEFIRTWVNQGALEN